MQISKLIMIKKINNTTAERRVSYPRQQLSLHRINLGWRCKLYAPHCLTASRYVAVHVSVSCSSNVWAPWKKWEESWIEKMWETPLLTQWAWAVHRPVSLTRRMFTWGWILATFQFIPHILVEYAWFHSCSFTIRRYPLSSYWLDGRRLPCRLSRFLLFAFSWTLKFDVVSLSSIRGSNCWCILWFAAPECTTRDG